MWVATGEEYAKAIIVRGSELLNAVHSLSFLLFDGVDVMNRKPLPDQTVQLDNTSIIVQLPLARFLKSIIAELALKHRYPSSPQPPHHHQMITHVP